MAEIIYMKTAKNENKQEGDKRPHYAKTFQAKKTFTIQEGKFYKNAIQKDKGIMLPNLYPKSDEPLHNIPKKRFSIELTPQLKEKVKKGMAMFSATPLIVGQEND